MLRVFQAVRAFTEHAEAEAQLSPRNPDEQKKGAPLIVCHLNVGLAVYALSRTAHHRRHATMLCVMFYE